MMDYHRKNEIEQGMWYTTALPKKGKPINEVVTQKTE